VSLLARSSARYLLKRPLRALLAVAGIALGVSVVVAIDRVNASAERAFRLSTEAVAGRATHQISGGSLGLDERLLATFRAAAPGLPFAPIVEDVVVLPSPDGRGRNRTLRLLGVDPFSEPPFRSLLAGSAQPAAGSLDVARLLTERGAVLLSAVTAAELGLEAGDRFTVRVGTRPRELSVLGTIEPADETARAALANLLVADIATAQETLGLIGRLSRVETLAAPSEPAAAAALEALTRGLPPGAVLEPTAARAGALETMTRAFRLNLRALSWLALLCGALLIYNTMSFSVVERRSLFGLLRAVGASRHEVFLLVLAEAAALGLLGSALGGAAGAWLGRGLVALVTQTINDLYFVLSVRDAAAASGSILRGGAIGLAVTLLAAAAPAREAMGVDPRSAIAQSALEIKARRWSGGALFVGVGCFALSALCFVVDARSLPWAFAGLFALLVGAAAVTPAATAAFGSAIGAVPGIGLRTRLAARGLVRSLSRTAVAVAALSLAIATAIGVDLMITSFRGAVETWLSGTLAADFYVAPPQRMATAAQLVIPDELVAEARALPGIERVHTLRTATAPSGSAVGARGGAPLRVSGIDLSRRGFEAFDLGAAGGGSSAYRVWEDFQAGAAIVSQPLAYNRRLKVGDTLTLASPAGSRVVPIRGIFRDYGPGDGVVVVADATFRAVWPEAKVAALSVLAPRGASSAELRALESALRDLAREDREIVVESSRSLREGSMAIFDRTFRVTGVLRLLTLAVAVIGVLAALTSVELERAREFGVLRAQGMTPGELVRLVLTETGLLGLAAALLAMPLGALLSALLVYVINRRSFGWSMDLVLEPRAFAVAAGLALAAALLAGLYPAWRVGRVAPAEVLRSE
jgi:putative ABC transport system permease protein